MKKFFFYIGIAPLIILTGCGPKLEEKQREAPVIPAGAFFHDTIITAFAEKDFAKENLVTRSTPEDVLRQTEFTLDIAAVSQLPAWKKKAVANYLDAEKKLTAKKLDFANSNYLDLVYSQINGDVKSNIKDVDKQILADTAKLLELIRKKQASELQLTLDSTFSDKLNQTQSFLDAVVSGVKKMDILPEFKTTFLSELKSESQSLLKEAVELENNLSSSKTLSDSIKAIAAFVEKTSTQLTAEDAESLQKGQQLADVLGAVNDGQSGLQAIAIVWTLLDDQKRVDYIKSANEELYGFLADKSADDIQCLTDKNCKGLITKIILKIGVYPKIEKFGADQIVALINSKGIQFVAEKVNRVAFGTLQKIGETITEKVLISVANKRSELGHFKDNLREQLSIGLDEELNRQKVKTSQAVLVDDRKILSDFDSQTNYIRNKIKFLPFAEEKNKLVQLQFEVIEGITGLPLFSQSIADEAKTIRNDIVELLLNPEPRQYLNSVSTRSPDVDLKQQSELLMTTALALNEVADWRTSSFDQALSSITADNILTQFQSDDPHKPFFGKSDLISIVLSVSSHTLKLMQGSHSPLVLINNENKLIPVESLSDPSAGPIALAAATDFKLNEHVQTVNASDMSEFLMALLRFYSATEGIENTQSELLKKTKDANPSLLSELVNSRQTIRQLIVAGANFISNQLIQPNGLVSGSISLAENLKPSQKYGLLDQTRAIEALVKAYEVTQVDAYLWTAQNIYFSMNRLLYSETMKFYQQNTDNEIQTQIDYTVLLETYKNLSCLKSHLKEEEQIQFEKIFKAWLNLDQGEFL